MFRLIFVLLIVPVFGFSLTAKEIIQKVDDNQLFKTEKYEATMVIQKGSQKLTKKFNGYTQTAGKKSFMEFTNPEDKGVKYLKLSNQLWIYFPDADDTMKISGHMLQKGMMGSDISYEDMLEENSLDEQYVSSLAADTNVNGVLCYHIVLVAKSDKVTYAKQDIFIDKTKYVMVEAIMYAVGDRPIKRMTALKVEKIGGRYFITEMEIVDLRQKNTKTVVSFNKIELDVALPKDGFSMSKLK
ncbi:MAG: hypothetical protein A2Y33_10800 [Spirochaetes bacterium GWF1_51_8]|nr:MAG: hypothetical protein A2Y33_10800 [Spirochaetes bacterium GWF1_51_8]